MPLLAVVVFLIAGGQVGAVIDALALLPVIVPLFILFSSVELVKTAANPMLERVNG